MAGYIKFDSVDGEDLDAGHKGWTKIKSLEHTIHKPTKPGATGVERRRADTVYEDMTVQMVIDKAFCKVFESFSKGKVFPKVSIHFTRSFTDAGRKNYLTYELENVYITSMSSGGMCQASEIPGGEVSLNFAKVTLTYLEADTEGKEKGSVPMTWKVEEGEA